MNSNSSKIEELISFLAQSYNDIDDISLEIVKSKFDNIDFSDEEYLEENITKRIENYSFSSEVEKVKIIEKIMYFKARSFIEIQDSEEKDSEEKDSEDTSKKILIKEYISEHLEVPVSEVSIEDEEINIKLIGSSAFFSKCESYKKWQFENVTTTFNEEFGVPCEKIFTVNSLSEYVETVTSLDEFHNCLSRGQKDCTFELEPSLFRTGREDLSRKESDFNEHFKSKASYYDNNISGKSNDSIIAYGQHYGLPTRYLDFTDAHLLSLFFAVEEFEYTDRPSIVYLINSVSVNSKNVDYQSKALNYSDRNVVESFNKYSDKAYFIKLEDANARIHFQKGYFLRVPNDEKLQIKTILENYAHVIIINPDNKKQILKDLFSMGITYESIYPDLDNLIKNIKFQQLER